MTDLIDREGMRRDVLVMADHAFARYLSTWILGEFDAEKRLSQFERDCRAFAAELEGRINES